MKKLALLIGMLMPLICRAGDIHIAQGGRSNSPETTINVKASHVSIDITANASKEKGVLKEWGALARFKSYLEGQARESGIIRIDRVASTYMGREAKRSFGSYGATSNYRLRISTSLQSDENFIVAATRLRAFIDMINPEEVITFRVGSYYLAIENKSQYREKILSLISAEIEAVKKGLGESYSARLYDFTNEIVVTQVGEETLSLYFNYSVEYVQ